MWIQTYTGKQYFPLNPKTEDIDIVDIAYSLSMQCRFNGHCTQFYSVAQHSYLLSTICSREMALWGLLHDAAEAYLCDLPRPVKQHLSGYKEIEELNLKAIAEKFNLSWPMPHQIRRLDNDLLATEAKLLMVKPPAPWGLSGKILNINIDYWGPSRGAREFLLQFHSLINRDKK